MEGEAAEAELRAEQAELRAEQAEQVSAAADQDCFAQLIGDLCAGALGLGGEAPGPAADDAMAKGDEGAPVSAETPAPPGPPDKIKNFLRRIDPFAPGAPLDIAKKKARDDARKAAEEERKRVEEFEAHFADIDFALPPHGKPPPLLPPHVTEEADTGAPPEVARLNVDASVRILRVAQVNTVSGTFMVKLVLTTWWDDPRLIGWMGKLPDNLWTPRLALVNCMAGLEEELILLEYVGPERGRLMAVRRYEGEMANTMDLREFPFDHDELELIFSANFFELADGSARGTQWNQTVQPVCRADQEMEALKAIEAVRLEAWDGEILEWQLMGLSTTFEKHTPFKEGIATSIMRVNFHVRRRTSYYFWKALLPLFMLTAIAMTTSIFDVDAFVDRMGMVVTVFLANSATLYVIAVELPKTDFLTVIDRIIVQTLLMNFSQFVISWVAYELYKRGRETLAQRLNDWVTIGLVIAFTVANVITFVPRVLNGYRFTRDMAEPFERLVPSIDGSTEVLQTYVPVQLTGAGTQASKGHKHGSSVDARSHRQRIACASLASTTSCLAACAAPPMADAQQADDEAAARQRQAAHTHTHGSV